MTVLANPFSDGKDKRSDSVVLSRLPPEFLYIDWPLLYCRKVGDGKLSDVLNLVLCLWSEMEVLGDVHKYIKSGILTGIVFENVEMVEGAVAVALEIDTGLFIDLLHGSLKIRLPLVYLSLRERPRG